MKNSRAFLPVAGAVLATLLLCGPAPAAAPGAPADLRLANGMHLIVVPDRFAPVVTTSMVYQVGSDEQTLPGQAHALEHMLFRGSRDISATQFAELAARMGASYNAQTTNAYTQFYFSVPSRYLDVVLHIEADRMRGALLRQADWERERGAIEQEVKTDHGTPTFDLENELNALFFAGTPYTSDTLGTIAGFDAMTAAQIRTFYDTWYHPNDATLVIAGDVDPATVAATVRSLFGAIPSAPLPARPPVDPAPVQPASIVQRLNVAYPTVQLKYRVPGIASPDFPALSVLMAALNNTRGSLADFVFSGQVLRANASVGPLFPEVGVATIEATLRPDSDVSKIERQLDAIVAGYVKSGVSDDEVRVAKRRVLSGRAFEFASISGVAFSWSQAQAEGLGDPNVWLQSFDRVTTADVNRVLRADFGPEQRVAVAIQPQAGGSDRAVSLEAAPENVAYTATRSESLPAWTEPYFAHPLDLPNLPVEKKSWVLPNGVKLLVQRVRVAPVVVMSASIESRPNLTEPQGQAGVSDLTDALMNWGSATLDRKAFSAALDAIPANVTAGTSFGLTSLSGDFDRTLDLLADEMLRPGFPHDGFDLIKQNYLRELITYQDEPSAKAGQALDEALYPVGDPDLRRPTPESLSLLSLDDVKAWYAKAFRPDLTSISVVGDVDPGAVHAAVVRDFGGWRATGAKPDLNYPSIPLNGPESSTIASPNSKQATVELTELIALTKNDPKRFALMLGDTMLTNEGSASLLFNDLREVKGYVYGVDSVLAINRQRSFYGFSFASDPANADKATQALLVDVHHLQTDAVSDDDLTQAKSLIVARSIMPTASYAGLAAGSLSDMFDSNDLDSIDADNDRDWKALFAVTPGDVRDAMIKWVRLSDFVRINIVPSAP